MKDKDMKKFVEDYVKLDVTLLNMTFGVLWDSCVEVLAKRGLELLKNERDSEKRHVRIEEMLYITEEILWAIAKELEWKTTKVNRLLFGIKLMEDSRKYRDTL